MKAVVFYGVGDIRVREEPDPTIQQRTDAIVRLTASAICGTDLHMVRRAGTGRQEFKGGSSRYPLDDCVRNVFVLPGRIFRAM